MSEPTAARDTARCPSCGARVVADQDWCSLCLQPLRAPAAADDRAADDPARDDLPSGDPGPVADPADPYGSSAGAEEARARPAGDLPPLAAEAMLAELAAATAAERPLARGPLAGAGRSTRLALGCGAAVVLVGVLTLVLTLLGMLL